MREEMQGKLVKNNENPRVNLWSFLSRALSNPIQAELVPYRIQLKPNSSHHFEISTSYRAELELSAALLITPNNNSWK